MTTPAPGGRISSPDFVQSLARGLRVIEVFDASRPRQTLSEVARVADLTRATARRFLRTLADLGYVGTDGTSFWLTPRVLDLGYSYLSSMPLPEIAQPHLEKLSSAVGESSSVSILDSSDVVYVSRVQVRRIMTVGITIGTRFPAHTTSMGRVLLAGLSSSDLDDYFAHTPLEVEGAAFRVPDEETLRQRIDAVARKGYALVDQELEPGLRSLAAPIRDAEGRVVAAVNLSTHAMRYSIEQLEADFLPRLLSTADSISTDLRSVNR